MISCVFDIVIVWNLCAARAFSIIISMEYNMGEGTVLHLDWVKHSKRRDQNSKYVKCGYVNMCTYHIH